MIAADWTPDRLLPDFQAHTWEIEGAKFAEGEPDEAPLTATLVRRRAPAANRAVLYIHGWDDYFFQRQLADYWVDAGYDFYALDLRRYGRNLRRGLLAGYITDLRDYFTEIDDAFLTIKDEGHDKITVMGHSTGGLITSLWANDTPHQLNGLILNSPWLDMMGSPALWAALTPLVNSVARLQPTTAMQLTDYGHYITSLGKTGDWGIDFNFKSHPAFIVRFGWGKAILKGQERIAKGLDIDTPVLSLMSTRSITPTKNWDDAYLSADTILDVERLAPASIKLGKLVTLVRIEDGMHDLVLSKKPVRENVYRQITRWAKAYL